MTYITIEGCELEISPAYTPSSGTAIIQTAASSKVKIANSGGVLKGVYRGNIVVMVPSGVSGGYTFANPFTVTITGSAVKTKADGQFVVLEGDSGTSTPQTGTNPVGATTQQTFTVKIKSAGQTKVKGT